MHNNWYVDISKYAEFENDRDFINIKIKNIGL